MHDLTSFQRDILIVLSSQHPISGSELREELDRYYETEVFGGRLYPALDDLVERGYVSKSRRDGRTYEYRVTDSGLRAIDARNEWVDGLVAELD